MSPIARDSVHNRSRRPLIRANQAYGNYYNCYCIRCGCTSDHGLMTNFNLNGWVTMKSCVQVKVNAKDSARNRSFHCPKICKLVLYKVCCINHIPNHKYYFHLNLRNYQMTQNIRGQLLLEDVLTIYDKSDQKMF